MIHRDIKPENLLLTDDGNTLVADFGIARGLQAGGAGDDKLTDTGLVVGTPAYMSPEQAAGDPHLDGRSDLYSLGVVLYELIGGRIPFTGRTAQQVIASRFLTKPASLHELRTDVPPPLAALVERLLAVRAADRVADAAYQALTRTLGRRGQVETQGGP